MFPFLTRWGLPLNKLFRFRRGPSWALSAFPAATPWRRARPQTGCALADEEGELAETRHGHRIRGVASVALIRCAGSRDAEPVGSRPPPIFSRSPQITSRASMRKQLGSAAPSNITRATAPNLRGLGSTATLTILDGRRLSASGTMGQYVDPAVLPMLALERVEVIADGASAIYGSDAVAGVVNLIPRKNFEGVELAARGALGDSYSDNRVSGIGGTVGRVAMPCRAGPYAPDTWKLRSRLRDERPPFVLRRKRPRFHVRSRVR